MKGKNYDLAIIGGGINGSGLAAAAAACGLTVFLCDQKDLASATSSASSKLIHGGLRYLENYEFGLVAESLAERERLLTIAKHLVRPQSFIIPYQPQMRSRFIIRLGLFIYDHLARRSTLAKTKTVNLKNHPAGVPLLGKYRFGFQYFDCKTDDSRLVIANAQHAAQYGATIVNYTQCIAAEKNEQAWQVTLFNHRTQIESKICAKALINVTGPWADQFLTNVLRRQVKQRLKLIKGSHIVVPRFYEGDFAYLLQNDDKRVIFVIPYQEEFLLIGTTDIFYQEAQIYPTITAEEIDYLTSSVEKYFAISPAQLKIIDTFSGVRPLLDENKNNPASISRGYSLELLDTDAPFITVYGGKLTTYRSLSEKVMNLLQSFFPNMKPYSQSEQILPGSDYVDDEALFNELHIEYPWLPPPLLHRYLRSYGTLTKNLLINCTDLPSLGRHFGALLFQREVDYLLEHEWATSVDDILWRRSKLGLVFPKDQLASLAKYIKTKQIDTKR